MNHTPEKIRKSITHTMPRPGRNQMEIERDNLRAEKRELLEALYEVANVSLQASDRAELKRAVYAARDALQFKERLQSEV
jgi:hypothetical protein